MTYENNYFAPLKKKVLWILKKHPGTRDSDKLLFSKICEVFYKSYVTDRGHGNIYFSLDDLFQLPHIPDLARIRREIQHEDNMYLPISEEVAKNRKIKQELWLRYVRQHYLV